MSDTTVTQLDDLPTDPPLGALVTAILRASWDKE